MTLDQDRENLLESLRELAASTARERRLLLRVDPVYMLFLAGDDHKGVRCEVVSSRHLPPELKLSPARAKQLREYGFSKASGRSNWSAEFGRTERDLEKLSELAIRVLRKLYAAEGPAEYVLAEDNKHHPKNPELLLAMRGAARGYDPSARRKLYSELVNATFLVPTSEDVDDSTDAEDAIELHPTEDGVPAVAVFTDWAALRAWEPQGQSYLRLHGSELFEFLNESPAQLLYINPEGDVGGLLYRQEVEMLAETVRKFRRKMVN